MGNSLDSSITEEPPSRLRLSEIRKSLAFRVTEPVARLLSRTAITPNTITWIGFLLALGVAALIITGHLFAAGWVVLIGGFCDMLDGALARYSNRVTRFGAILDSTLDRVSEAVALIAILVLFTREQLVAQTLLVSVALLGSFLVSYIRARAESIGLKCQVGLLTRTERVIILTLGLLLSHFPYALVVALIIIAVFSFITAGQRLIYVWQQTRVK